MITMTEWEEDLGEVVREGEAKNAKAHNLKELFKRADLDGCESQTACGCFAGLNLLGHTACLERRRQ